MIVETIMEIWVIEERRKARSGLWHPKWLFTSEAEGERAAADFSASNPIREYRCIKFNREVGDAGKVPEVAGQDSSI